MHRDKYEVQTEPRQSFTEKIASYYGNLRTRLLGSNLAGRRTTFQEKVFVDDTQLTSFKEKKDTEAEGQLKPRIVDLQRTLNRDKHRTSDYEIPNLILRRGQSFEINITFDRPFIQGEDELVLKFVTGRMPLQSKGTVIPVFPIKELDQHRWGYQMIGVIEKTVTFKVTSSCDAIVGRYSLFVDTCRTMPEGDVYKSRYGHPDDIYIIFNPWCQGDLVYMPEETHREEYVLNETGRIWMGTVGRFCVRPWNFAQFDDVCLIAALALIEKSEVGDQVRDNPIQIVRALCKVIVNNERDGGVLNGNWSGKYDDGVAPYAWNGSSAILEEFLKKRKGVKYGQCWTFAAVATTIFRALGIPTRCVTNFKSAHDNDYNAQIDAYWTLDGKPRKLMDDVIWDFHVWNESWFRRPDLRRGYDGWQAFDPTPQEGHEGVLTCGPASVIAIRNGEVYYGYDAKFLFAEVNGDRVHWMVDSEGNMVAIGVENRIVGRNISTKAVCTISREDLTSAYKPQEGSKEETEVLKRARRICFRCLPTPPHQGPQDVEFKFSGDSYRTGDIGVSLNIRNTSVDSRIVDVFMCAVSARYTGVPTQDLKETNSTTVIEPLTETQVALSVKCSEYINAVDSDNHINVYAMAVVKETEQRFITRETFWVEKPHLELKTEGNGVTGKPLNVVVKLTNPFSVPLSGGYINVEGPGMQRIQTVKLKKPIAPGEEIRETVQVKPRRAGRKEIIANFYCKQVSDVTGVAIVDVTEEAKS